MKHIFTRYYIVALFSVYIGSIFASFPTNDFKKPHFKSEILPNSFTSLHNLLLQGHHEKKDAAFAAGVLTLFGNMLHAAEYVNPAALYVLLEQMPELMSPYMTQPRNTSVSTMHTKTIENFHAFQQQTYNLLYHQFSHNFDTFKTEPINFLHTISEEICVQAQAHYNEIQLHAATERFIEIALSKLIWSPRNADQIWPFIKELARNIDTLRKKNIVSSDQSADNLYWTLVHRLCYFIDLTRNSLPINFFHTIREDIQTKTPLFLSAPEQEACIETKTYCLLRTLVEAEAKKRAIDAGIVRTQS